MRQRAQQTIRTQAQATLRARATVTRIAVGTPPTPSLLSPTAGGSFGAFSTSAPYPVGAGPASFGAASPDGLASPPQPGAAGGGSSGGGEPAVPPSPTPVSTGMTGKRLQGSRALVSQASARGRMSSYGSMSSTFAGGGHAEGGGGGGASSGAVAAAAAAAVKAALSGISIGGADAVPPRPVPRPAGGGAASSSSAPPPQPTPPLATDLLEASEAADAAGAAEADGRRVADLPCAACGQPLLHDDGMEALGRHFHVDCFACATCAEPFRDSAFYVAGDGADGRAYCKADYLRVCGAGVCAGCMAALKPGEEAIQVRAGRDARDGRSLPSPLLSPPPRQIGERTFHPAHFSCEGCGCTLDADADVFERGGAPYCDKCNLRLFGSCPACQASVADEAGGEVVSALGRNWHAACLKCEACACAFADGVYFTHDDGDGGERGRSGGCTTPH